MSRLNSTAKKAPPKGYFYEDYEDVLDDLDILFFIDLAFHPTAQLTNKVFAATFSTISMILSTFNSLIASLCLLPTLGSLSVKWVIHKLGQL